MPIQNNGQEFECRVSALFEDLDYPIFDTPESHDYGADLLLHFKGQEIAIQCKDQAAPVGIGAVQEAVAAVAYYHSDCAAVFTTSTFTTPARKLAAANHVALVDGWTLREMEQDITGELSMFESLLGAAPQIPRPPIQKPGLLDAVKQLFGQRPALS